MRITDYEIIDHGADHEQFFPGCATAFSRFSFVVTGAGDTPRDAVEDALNRMADVGDLDDDCPAGGCLLMEASSMSRESEIPDVMPGDGTEEAPEGYPNPYWHHYVSIRYNL